jgi:cytochrome c-type biogenesis protein CcmH/NrfG
MFIHKKRSNPNQQIPYAVYETLQHGHSRRYRWLYEVTVAAIIVLILSLGAVLVYRLVHNSTKTPTPTHSANVIQKPQNTALSAAQTEGTPSPTAAAKSTNNSSIPEPKN